MAPVIPTVKFHDGTENPLMGFGLGTTWYYAKGADRFGPYLPACVEITKKAIAAGYRKLDNAEMYGTEVEMGAAMRESGVPRKDFFVCTKVNQSMADVAKALDSSLEKMQTDYVDLFLLHHPYYSSTEEGLQNQWREMEKLQLAGKAKAIGVSNFDREDVEVILKTAKIKPAVNQLEYHPYHPRVSEKYVAWLQSQGIVVEAYFGLVTLTPLGKGGPLDEPLAAIAKDHNVDPAVVLQRWLLQQNIVSLNTTSKEERVPQAFGALDIELSEKEMNILNTVGQSGEGYPKKWVGPVGLEATDTREWAKKN